MDRGKPHRGGSQLSSQIWMNGSPGKTASTKDLKKRETKRKKERPRVRDFRSCFITSNFSNTKKKQTFPVCLIITLSFFNCDYHNFIFLKKLFF